MHWECCSVSFSRVSEIYHVPLRSIPHLIASISVFLCTRMLNKGWNWTRLSCELQFLSGSHKSCLFEWEGQNHHLNSIYENSLRHHWTCHTRNICRLLIIFSCTLDLGQGSVQSTCRNCQTARSFCPCYTTLWGRNSELGKDGFVTQGACVASKGKWHF